MIESGKTAKVHYKGTLNDGTVFDSSEGRDPLEFTVGSGQVIPGFDAAVQEMVIGGTKTVTIPCAEAYGEVVEELVAIVPHDQFPPELKPEVGQTLELQSPQGNLPARVIEITDAGVQLDGNHPLAGQDLTFELTLVEVI